MLCLPAGFLLRISHPFASKINKSPQSPLRPTTCVSQSASESDLQIPVRLEHPKAVAIGINWWQFRLWVTLLQVEIEVKRGCEQPLRTEHWCAVCFQQGDGRGLQGGVGASKASDLGFNSLHGLRFDDASISSVFYVSKLCYE
ncbi:hypothetical protein EYF80_005388 [Liparis tanakae]|uniref:Uncharacterized protein n=1 Tax=Liparis tanakae TaxID=230148 RepID=A0A4Z2J218_9TELE|nr:hypothetical protein EYF80_005388 [Liparis tanakae]